MINQIRFWISRGLIASNILKGFMLVRELFLSYTKRYTFTPSFRGDAVWIVFSPDNIGNEHDRLWQIAQHIQESLPDSSFIYYCNDIASPYFRTEDTNAFITNHILALRESLNGKHVTLLTSDIFGQHFFQRHLHITIDVSVFDFPEDSEDITDIKKPLAHIHKPDRVMVASRALENAVYTAGRREEVYYIPNGIEADEWKTRDTRSERLKLEDIFLEILQLGKPIIGYYGDCSIVDMDLIHTLATENTDMVFVLLSELDISVPTDFGMLGNVYAIGNIARDNIKYHVAHFTVGMLPLYVGEDMKFISPKTLLPYFVQGKPVVVTNIPEVAAFSGSVYVVSDGNMFSTTLREAIIRANDIGYTDSLRTRAHSLEWEDILTPFLAKNKSV